MINMIGEVQMKINNGRMQNEQMDDGKIIMLSRTRSDCNILMRIDGNYNDGGVGR